MPTKSPRARRTAPFKIPHIASASAIASATASAKANADALDECTDIFTKLGDMILSIMKGILLIPYTILRVIRNYFIYWKDEMYRDADATIGFFLLHMVLIGSVIGVYFLATEVSLTAGICVSCAIHIPYIIIMICKFYDD